MPLQLFMGILALLTYLYETPAGACLGYLILQTFCLILQISSRNPPFDPLLTGSGNISLSRSPTTLWPTYEPKGTRSPQGRTGRYEQEGSAGRFTFFSLLPAASQSAV